MKPWGSNISINDQGDGLQCTLSKFADDVKLRGVLHIPDGCATIQKDLKRLEKRADKNMLKFSKGKKGKKGSHFWGGVTPGLGTCGEVTVWKAALQKQKSQQSAPLWQRKPDASQAGEVSPEC